MDELVTITDPGSGNTARVRSGAVAWWTRCGWVVTAPGAPPSPKRKRAAKARTTQRTRPVAGASDDSAAGSSTDTNKE